VDGQQKRVQASPKVTNGEKTRLRNLQSALKKAQEAVTLPTELEKVMLKLNGEIPDKSKLYTKNIITKMCVDAMKQSFRNNQGILKAGAFSVTASNLGNAKVNVKLLASRDNTRINSCFPLD
jgi:hypothetical protein